MDDSSVEALRCLYAEFARGAESWPDLRHVLFGHVNIPWPGPDTPGGMESVPWREFLGRPQSAIQHQHFCLTHWLNVNHRAKVGGFYDHRGQVSQARIDDLSLGCRRFSELAELAWESWVRLGLVDDDSQPRPPLSPARRDRWLELVYPVAQASRGTICTYQYILPRGSIFTASAKAMRPLLASAAEARRLDKLRLISELPGETPDIADVRQQALHRAELEYETEMVSLPVLCDPSASIDGGAKDSWNAERRFNNSYSKLLIDMREATPFLNHGRADPHPAFESLVCTHDGRVTFGGKFGRCWAGLVWEFAVELADIPSVLHEVAEADRIYSYEAEQIRRVAEGLKSTIGDPAKFCTEWRAIWHDAGIEQAKAKRANGPSVELEELWMHTQKLFDDVAAIVSSMAHLGKLEAGGQVARPIDGTAKTDPEPFTGGLMVFFDDRVELCGVDICSGRRSQSKRVILELLNRRQKDGAFAAYSGAKLEAEVKERVGKRTAASIVRDLRRDIADALQNHANVLCGPYDVIVRCKRGYRFTDCLTVQWDCDGDASSNQGHVESNAHCDDPVADPDDRDTNDPNEPDGPDRDAAARRAWVLHELHHGQRLRGPDVVRQFKCSQATAKRDLRALKSKRLIKFKGSPRTGYYHLTPVNQDPD